MRPQFEVTIEMLLVLLARGEYETVARMTSGRLDARSIREGIESYGHVLVEPPSDFWRFVDIVTITASDGGFSVRVPFFTQDEGRSDLELFLTLTEIGDCLLEAQIDGIRVP
jgi:hypothetical protein